MVASRYRPSLVSNQTGVPYDVSDAHRSTQFLAGQYHPIKGTSNFLLPLTILTANFTSGAYRITQLDTLSLGVLAGTHLRRWVPDD